MAARELGIRSLARAAASVSNAQLGEKLGGELAGAQAREGGLVLTASEAAVLLPPEVAFSHLIDLLRERLAAETVATDSPERLRAIALLRVHLDAIDVLRNL